MDQKTMDQKAVDQKALFLRLWEKEAPATRKVLSRIPEDSTYRPDPKSRTAREIAWLIVREEMVLIDGLENGQLEWEEIPAPASMKEVLATYDRHRERLCGTVPGDRSRTVGKTGPVPVRGSGDHERNRL